VLVFYLETLVVVYSLISCISIVIALGASNLVVDVWPNLCVEVPVTILTQPLNGV
jgi:hypothetical protein